MDATLRNILRAEAAIARRLGIMEDELSPSPPPAGTAPAQAPRLLVTVPFQPQDLTAIMFAAARHEAWSTVKGIFSIEATVPAASGGTPGEYVLRLEPPVGMVTLFVAPIRVTATSYSPQLVASGSVDGIDFTQGKGVALMGPVNAGIPLYTATEHYALLRLVNGSAYPSTVSAFFQVLAVPVSIYRNVWAGLIRAGLHAATEMAAMTGGRA